MMSKAGDVPASLPSLQRSCPGRPDHNLPPSCSPDSAPRSDAVARGANQPVLSSRRLALLPGPPAGAVARCAGQP